MKKIAYTFLLSLFVIVSAHAQKRDITGKVTNKTTGEALEGVNILVDKSKSGTATKKILNFISSTVMIKMGKVAGSYMIDMACMCIILFIL